MSKYLAALSEADVFFLWTIFSLPFFSSSSTSSESESSSLSSESVPEPLSSLLLLLSDPLAESDPAAHPRQSKQVHSYITSFPFQQIQSDIQVTTSPQSLLLARDGIVIHVESPSNQLGTGLTMTTIVVDCFQNQSYQKLLCGSLDRK